MVFHEGEEEERQNDMEKMKGERDEEGRLKIRTDGDKKDGFFLLLFFIRKEGSSIFF